MAEHHDRSSGSSASASDTRPADDLAEGLEPAREPDDEAGIDVLSDVLRSIRLTGALFFPFVATSPWADDVPGAPTLVPAILPGAQHVVSYHIVVEGACWVALAGRPATRLESGDIVVIPHGDAYGMSSAPGVRSDLSEDDILAFFRQMAAGSAPTMVIEGGGGLERAEVVCGFLACDVRPFNPVLEALPRLVHLRRPEEGSTHDRLRALVDLAVEESRERRAGAKCALLRIGEVLFIEVVRRYLDSLATERTGWLAGLRDPIVGRALAYLHDRPADAWTLEGLAHAVGVSRSVLADRFTQIVGQPPMRYLTRWRVQLASRLLAEGMSKVSAVALDVGYRSEAAFSRAFKEIAGVPPAAWRRAPRDGVG